MQIRIKPTLFLDHLTFEFDPTQQCILRALLKDDKGKVLSSMETSTENNQSVYHWRGLNDLPYGVYTCEIFGGDRETRIRLIKCI